MGTEWDLVGGDPAPGDAATIRALALSINRTASEARDVELVLSSVSCDLDLAAWAGKAAQAYAVAFKRIPPELKVMATSYENVAESLTIYGDELDALQAEGRAELRRGQDAERRKVGAETRMAAASRLITDLERQLYTVEITEKHLELSEELAATTANVPAYTHVQQELIAIRATKRAINQALGTARSSLSHARVESATAADDLTRSRAVIEGIAVERRTAEKQAAASIDGAIAPGLRNASDFSRLVRWSEGELKDYSRLYAIPGDLVTGHFQAAVVDYDRFLHAAGDILHIVDAVIPVLMKAAAVVVVIAGVFTLDPVAIAAGVAIYGSATELSEAFAAVETTIDIEQGAADSELYFVGYIDPETGLPMVSKTDLIKDGIALGTDEIEALLPEDPTGGVWIAQEANNLVKHGLSVEHTYDIARDIQRQGDELTGGDGQVVTGTCRAQ